MTAARRHVVAVGFLLAVLAASACGSSSSSTPAPSTGSSTSSSSTTTAAPTVLAPPLLPLYPFQTAAEATAWRQDTNHDTRFAEAGTTALGFAQLLGYTEIDRVVRTRSDATGAHVAVGAVVPDTDRVITAAIVHLVRFSADPSAPWEVVGTDDTDLTMTEPAYGSAVASPLSVAGRITGVDESIRVRVVQLHANGALGESCCTPAGGQDSAWSASVTFAPPTDPVLMVSVSTGGHVRDVERFAVNGVRRADPR